MSWKSGEVLAISFSSASLACWLPVLTFILRGGTQQEFSAS